MEMNQGDQTACQSHINGLLTMIKVRGGLEKIRQEEPFLNYVFDELMSPECAWTTPTTEGDHNQESVPT